MTVHYVLISGFWDHPGIEAVSLALVPTWRKARPQSDDRAFNPAINTSHELAPLVSISISNERWMEQSRNRLPVSCVSTAEVKLQSCAGLPRRSGRESGSIGLQVIVATAPIPPRQVNTAIAVALSGRRLTELRTEDLGIIRQAGLQSGRGRQNHWWRWET